jgi:hypothetical protein
MISGGTKVQVPDGGPRRRRPAGAGGPHHDPRTSLRSSDDADETKSLAPYSERMATGMIGKAAAAAAALRLRLSAQGRESTESLRRGRGLVSEGHRRNLNSKQRMHWMI